MAKGKRGGNNSRKNKIIELPTPANSKNMVDNENGWNYPGITERIDKMETALNNARSNRKISSIYSLANSTDALITDEIERLHNNTADVPGNENVLLTARRRVRKIIQNIKKMQ